MKLSLLISPNQDQPFDLLIPPAYLNAKGKLEKNADIVTNEYSFDLRILHGDCLILVCRIFYPEEQVRVDQTREEKHVFICTLGFGKASLYRWIELPESRWENVYAALKYGLENVDRLVSMRAENIKAMRDLTE